jgi:NADPH:quinone reductase-like Zn-dependent oxidoreductase
VNWDCKRVLVPGGVLVQAGAPKENPVGHIVAIRLAAIGGGRRIANFVAAPSRDDLRALAELAVAGTLRPVVERRYAFGELREALAYVGEGHTRGKVVVAVS